MRSTRKIPLAAALLFTAGVALLAADGAGCVSTDACPQAGPPTVGQPCIGTEVCRYENTTCGGEFQCLGGVWVLNSTRRTRPVAARRRAAATSGHRRHQRAHRARSGVRAGMGSSADGSNAGGSSAGWNSNAGGNAMGGSSAGGNASGGNNAGGQATGGSTSASSGTN